MFKASLSPPSVWRRRLGLPKHWTSPRKHMKHSKKTSRRHPGPYRNTFASNRESAKILHKCRSKIVQPSIQLYAELGRMRCESRPDASNLGSETYSQTRRLATSVLMRMKGFRCAWNRRQREINPLLKVTTISRDENEQRTRRLPENAGSNRRRHLEKNWARSGEKKIYI